MSQDRQATNTSELRLVSYIPLYNTNNTKKHLKQDISIHAHKMINVILLVIITIFIPPVGVFLVKGCGADLLINIALTILGYFPGHIHAFYIEYKYYKARDQATLAANDGYAAPVSAQPGYGTVGSTGPQRV